MAAPASNSHKSALSQTTPWTRPVESGTASQSSGRGRGRGSGRGRGRGGRGGVRDPKLIGTDSTNNNPNTTSTTATSASKPVARPPSADGKPSVPSTTQAPPKQKLSSRRTSHTVPPNIPSDSNGATDASGNLKPTRPQNRNRRSQSGKHVPTPLPKINVQANDDNILRPPRHRLPHTPHTAPIKDTPPHLPGGSFDMRSDIDALVERVRAVAMENRPNTPGSHIDWAGDDDDSLPDLDDWGVTPAPAPGHVDETISPIVVDGLKTLPDIHTEPSLLSVSVPSGLLNEVVSNTSLIQKETQKAGIQSPLEMAGLPKANGDLVTPVTTTRSPLILPPELARVSLHSSVPSKPADSLNDLSDSRSGGDVSPMRKYINNTEKPTPTTDQVTTGNTQPPAVVVEGSQKQKEQQIVGTNHVSSDTAATIADPFAKFSARDGLNASIHARSEMTESKSFPNNLSSHSPSTGHRTHARAHTTGRPFRPETSGRPSRSGYNTPSGTQSGEGGGYHTRTHSTPPTGQYSHRNAAHRPVITGDAITRLARTIGGRTFPNGRTAMTMTAQD